MKESQTKILSFISSSSSLPRQDSGTDLSDDVSSIIVGLVQVLATAFASVLMDKAGRKFLLIISAAAMIVSLGVYVGFDFFFALYFCCIVSLFYYYGAGTVAMVLIVFLCKNAVF